MPDALRDLQRIWDYTVVTWSEAQADKYHKELLETCRMIASNTSLGRHYDKVSKSFLGRQVGKHVVFYTVAPEEVLIVRILHQSMNFGNWIEDEI